MWRRRCLALTPRDPRPLPPPPPHQHSHSHPSPPPTPLPSPLHPHQVRDESAFPLLDAAISEALRLATQSLTVRRVMIHNYVLPSRPATTCTSTGAAATNATTTTTNKLRKGDRVAMLSGLLHHDPAKVGPHPEEFQLDRYLAKSGTPLMPFGGGISLCPGRKFALREIKAFDRKMDSWLARATRLGLSIYPSSYLLSLSIHLSI